jgi:hypothetical protein
VGRPAARAGHGARRDARGLTGARPGGRSGARGLGRAVWVRGLGPVSQARVSGPRARGRDLPVRRPGLRSQACGLGPCLGPEVWGPRPQARGRDLPVRRPGVRSRRRAGPDPRSRACAHGPAGSADGPSPSFRARGPARTSPRVWADLARECTNARLRGPEPSLRALSATALCQRSRTDLAEKPFCVADRAICPTGHGFSATAESCADGGWRGHGRVGRDRVRCGARDADGAGAAGSSAPRMERMAHGAWHVARGADGAWRGRVRRCARRTRAWRAPGGRRRPTAAGPGPPVRWGPGPAGSCGSVPGGRSGRGAPTGFPAGRCVPRPISARCPPGACCRCRRPRPAAAPGP